MTINVKKLESGITILSDKFSSNILSLGVWLDVGSVNETKYQFGIAHMLEHMAFKGTKNRNAYEIAREIEDVGGDINAYTSKENTAYYVRLLSENRTLGVDILSDIIINSNFPNEEIERERGVILSEIGQSNDTPDDKVFENFTSKAFEGQSLGKPILGTEKSVKSFQKKDLIDFCRKFYTSSNIFIGICGDFSQLSFEREVSSNFEKLSLGIKSKKPPYYWKSGKVYKEKDLEQSHLVFGLEGLSNSDKDRFALRALSIILGGGMSSRLFQEVREKKGLCYSIFSFSINYSSSGVFGIYAGCLPKDLENLLDATLNELKKMKGKITKNEVERAKSQLRAGFLMSQESSLSRLERNMKSLMSLNKIISEQEILNEIDQIDSTKVEEVLMKILTSSKPVLSILGPKNSNLELSNYF